MKDQFEIVIQLGGNAGDRKKSLSEAINFLEKKITFSKYSKVYETEAWGVNDQPKFLNQVIRGFTPLNPYQLLSFCQNIENQMGRKRIIKWGSRNIDIDILLYANKVIFSSDLVIPHIHLQDRKFVLIPLIEVLPNTRHPLLDKTYEELLELCKDDLEVKLYKA